MSLEIAKNMEPSICPSGVWNQSGGARKLQIRPGGGWEAPHLLDFDASLTFQSDSRPQSDTFRASYPPSTRFWGFLDLQGRFQTLDLTNLELPTPIWSIFWLPGHSRSISDPQSDKSRASNSRFVRLRVRNRPGRSRKLKIRPDGGWEAPHLLDFDASLTFQIDFGPSIWHI